MGLGGLFDDLFGATPTHYYDGDPHATPLVKGARGKGTILPSVPDPSSSASDEFWFDYYQKQEQRLREFNSKKYDPPAPAAAHEKDQQT